MKYPSDWIISKMKMSLKWEIFSMCGLRHRIFKKFTHPCQWKTPQMPNFSKILQQHWNHHHHIFCAIFWSQYIQQKKMSPCPVFILIFGGWGQIDGGSPPSWALDFWILSPFPILILILGSRSMVVVCGEGNKPILTSLLPPCMSSNACKGALLGFCNHHNYDNTQHFHMSHWGIFSNLSTIYGLIRCGGHWRKEKKERGVTDGRNIKL